MGLAGWLSPGPREQHQEKSEDRPPTPQHSFFFYILFGYLGYKGAVSVPTFNSEETNKKGPDLPTTSRVNQQTVSARTAQKKKRSRGTGGSFHLEGFFLPRGIQFVLSIGPGPRPGPISSSRELWVIHWL